MPMISVLVATAASSEELSRTIDSTISDLTATILGKDPRVTAVAVDFIDPRQWYIAGQSSAHSGKSAFFVDVRISDGTNTKEEKAEYVARTFMAMERLLNAAHDESYVHVDDVRADAYGYGGLTRERRYIMSRPSPVAFEHPRDGTLVGRCLARASANQS